LVEYPFARDYYNALLCSTFNNDNNLSFDYLYKLREKGISFNYFDNNEYLEKLKKDKGWKNFEIYCKSNNERTNNKFKKDLKTGFDSMLRLEQKANSDRYSDPKLIYKFDSIILNNAERIKQIVTRYGFPDEQMLGISKPYDEPFSSVFFIHYNQKYNLSNDSTLLSILKSALKNGKLHPQVFLLITFDIRNYDLGNETVACFDTIIVKPQYISARLNRINHNRKELGIESFEESQKKAIFNITKKIWFISKKDDEPAKDFIERKHRGYKSNYFIIGSAFNLFQPDTQEQAKKLADKYKNRIRE